MVEYIKSSHLIKKQKDYYVKKRFILLGYVNIVNRNESLTLFLSNRKTIFTYVKINMLNFLRHEKTFIFPNRTFNFFYVRKCFMKLAQSSRIVFLFSIHFQKKINLFQLLFYKSNVLNYTKNVSNNILSIRFKRDLKK